MKAFHILIVEDNKSISIALESLLRKISFNNIDLAPNGLEALQKLICRQYDLIFLDNLMPTMSGLEFLRRCKCGPILDGTAVIMVTAAADTETVKAIRDEGLKVDEFIIKPLDFKVISGKIDRLLRSEKANPIQRYLQMDSLPANASRGAFLSVSTENQTDSVVIRMFGFFLNDDRHLVKELPELISNMPGRTVILDVRNILMIDAFGIGMLLVINGVATMAGKKCSMKIDDMTVGKRLRNIGIPTIISVAEETALSLSSSRLSGREQDMLPGHYDS